ncbi:MAG: penicillin-binding transpeptidase domain-containing protein [Arenicella sp.]
MKNHQGATKTASYSGIICLLLFCSMFAKAYGQATEKPFLFNGEQVAAALATHAGNSQFPSHLNFNDFGYAKVDYTFDLDLHSKIASIYRKYSPDYASFVAIDPETGAILSLTSYVRADDFPENFALGASYPAASVFKIITAANVLDRQLASLDTVIPFNGKSTSLYKKQVLEHKDNKYTRRPSLKEAFAKSSNPVFGRLGVEQIGRDSMLNYVGRFGFSRDIVQDLPVKDSQFNLPLMDEWELAEAASGYTKDILIGPVHAAAIAAAIVNGGQMHAPYAVQQVLDKNNRVLYQGGPKVIGEPIQPETAKDLLRMMRETVRIGSARKSFRTAHRYKAFTEASYGGKTGSLTGYEPRGRYDWFVGYGERYGKKIAYASLIVNKEKWYVRSSRVAFEVLNYFFKQAKEDTVVANK